MLIKEVILYTPKVQIDLYLFRLNIENTMKIIKNKKSFEITDFVIDKKYAYKQYTRNDEETGRTYNVNKNKIPSVTTILSATQSEEKRKSLDAWRERVGYQEAARITAQAARRGTEMHYVFRTILKWSRLSKFVQRRKFTTNDGSYYCR